ncbi:MAG: peptidase S41 [Bacteroidetes bacterium]|nr:peptidase S41 [Bacteroidota bacterium]
MKKLFLISTAIFALTVKHNLTAQNCSCADNFIWLKQTIEKNDAGFQYVIDKKGEEEYKKHNEIFSEKVKSIQAKEECAETLSNWLKFIRSGHIGIWVNADENKKENSNDNPDKNKKLFQNWETFSYEDKEFNSYLTSIKKPSLEGIWINPQYTIGIRKIKDEYIGFIIKGDNIYWSKEQVKLKIREENGKQIATYYMKDHSAKKFDDVELLGNNFLQIGFNSFKRVTPAFPSDKKLEMYFKFISTDVPLFEKLSDKTAILRIPSFEGSEKKLIDSVIDANKNIITKTENLIIDLRDNGGGSDGSYEKITPFIYTNPIRTIGAEFLSTTLNNQRMKEFTNDPDFSEEDKKWAKESLEKLNQHIGEFVTLDSSSVDIEKFDSVYIYPKNVGIIINENNGSTTEQFLLSAKQSKKVKLFGTTTRGVLDISNMYLINSPCNDLKLGYSLSRSKRIPDMTIDDKGIQPDYYIDKTISKYDWIDFVNKILSNE